jgi:hypothetical protein
MKKLLTASMFFMLITQVSAQHNYWQQAVKYTMNIDMDVNTNKLKGRQLLQYQNNSPESLDKVYYHLYWNAFQPNSSMDVRSRELGKVNINGNPDWDGRVKDRIQKLKEDEIGYQKIISIKMNGVPQNFEYHETILEVKLKKPIAPKTIVNFEMEFESQVPLQIRRSGRDNPKTGVRYSMSQWYPKICEYDREGWHPTPYVAREFYGVWGDFDVTIKIDSAYKLGGTGVLINAQEIGWGYDKPGTSLKKTNASKRSWHYVGKNIHDFVWAADPEYRHITKLVPNGLLLHVIYNDQSGDNKDSAQWENVANAAQKMLPFIEKKFGKYPYPQYSFIQGGDGGMEYPMATLISGPSLGTVFHEWMHSWYQMILATNESLYAWMDEGFTSFAEDLVTAAYYNQPPIREYEESLKENPKNQRLAQVISQMPDYHSGAYAGYFNLVKSGLEEPMATHADHYNSNYAYSVDAYSKGEVFLEQLGYIIGADMRDRVLLDYYKKWRFKHPNDKDFIRVAEQTSGIQLDWYRQYWIQSTKTIDYAIDSLWEEGGVSNIRIKRLGKMPMPVDLRLTMKDSSTEMHIIPLNLMYGSKSAESKTEKTIFEEAWRWTHPTYILQTKTPLMQIRQLELDPSKRMADTDRANNSLVLPW